MSFKREAWWTCDERDRAYYFAPSNRTEPPYKKQIEVTAILDIASDGTLAGVELVMGDLPPPPGIRAGIHGKAGEMRWRHKKRGSEYTEIGRGMLLDGEPVVIYRGDDGKYWVRPVHEFEDGRFEPVHEPATSNARTRNPDARTADNTDDKSKA